MAGNGIMSGVIPRAVAGNGGGVRMEGEGLDLFAGDVIYEQLNGEAGMLAAIEADPITGLSQQQKRDLLAKAGLNVRYASNA